MPVIHSLTDLIVGAWQGVTVCRDVAGWSNVYASWGTMNRGRCGVRDCIVKGSEAYDDDGYACETQSPSLSVNRDEYLILALVSGYGGQTLLIALCL